MLPPGVDVALAVVVLLAALYHYGKLDKWLPNKYRKHPLLQMGFVGAYGRTPEMEGCLAFSDSTGRSPHFNRCTYA